MTLDTWRGYAEKFNGSTVVWINQGDENSTVSKANSEGVCHAIASDWLLAYRSFLSERSEFVNAFRVYDEHSRLKEYSIPKKYLDEQAELENAVKLRRTERADLVKDYTKAKEADDKGSTSITKFTLQLAKDALKEHDRTLIGGADCKAMGQFKALDKLNEFMAKITTPRYCAVVVSGDSKNTAHIVAFEFRPDKSAGSFPGIFEFIDANTGLFAFRTSGEMLGFVKKYVWPMYSAYSLYDIYMYDTGFGGFGEMSEQEKKELAELGT